MQPYAGFEPQVGEIRALRTFRIGPDGLLYPLFSASPWYDGTNVARCRVHNRPAPDGRQHTPAEDDCTCGFYAYADERSADDYPHAKHVLAVVSCWGRVIAGTRGIRAQYARVDALWLDDVVPADLAMQVELRYPGARVYRDRAAMLAEHPPTHLDCYEPAAGALRWWQKAAVTLGLLAGALPAHWIDAIPYGRLGWGVLVALFVGAALLLRRRRTDLQSQRRRLACATIVLWLLAPFTGPAGIVFLRLPLLHLVAITVTQRTILARQARQFPADIR
jgi:hypothetical protein